MPAHVIVAQPGTLTGLIGVVTGSRPGRTMSKIGVGTGSVADGSYAEIYSPFRLFHGRRAPPIEEQMQATHELFLPRRGRPEVQQGEDRRGRAGPV
jgi:protease-4